MPPTTIRQDVETRPARKRPSWMRPGLLWIAFDILVPTALLYVVLWLGYGLYPALLASATLSAVTALIAFRRGSGKQRFALHMLVLSLAGFAVALVTGSDRFLLAKESVLTAMVGFWFLGSIWTSRPLTYQFTRPVLEGRLGMKGPPWEVLWEREPRFRHIWRVSSVMWAAATLIDAVLRVVMAYTLPVNSVPALQMGLFIVTGLLMQVVTNVYYMRAGLWPMVWQPYDNDETGSYDDNEQSPAANDRAGHPRLIDESIRVQWDSLLHELRRSDA